MPDTVVPISLASVAAVCYKLFDTSSVAVAVGNSSFDVLDYWPSEVKIMTQQVEIIHDSRVRSERLMRAEEIKLPVNAKACLVDDVAVSGKTLAAARSCILADLEVDAIIGMAWKSQRLARTAGQFAAAITYIQQGGGIPAVNTLSTLASNSKLLSDYAARQFGDSRSLDSIIDIYKKGEE